MSFKNIFAINILQLGQLKKAWDDLDRWVKKNVEYFINLIIQPFLSS